MSKKEVGEYALIHGKQAAIKDQTIKFNRTSVNCWKDKSKSRSDSGDYKKAGRPNMLDDALLVKVKYIALGTHMSGGVIKRQH